MIVIMKRGFSREELDTVIVRIEQGGARPIVGQANGTDFIGVVGREPGQECTVPPDSLLSCSGVEKIVPISEPYKLAGRSMHPQDTIVEVEPEGGICFRAGGGHLGIIAGPCAVESEDQTIRAARAVRAAGASALRGGAFKPRTSPYSFQGLKEDGLRILAAARRETGLAVITEVMTIQQIDLVARYADVLQIGSRNMHNYPLLEAVGRQSKPVLLKRGLCATLDELLLAAEYVLFKGSAQVMLCERGVRTFESETRFTLALTSVPLLQQKSHLPVIVDPSHSTGHDSLVAPMSRAAVAAGADGLMIEVHPDPIHSRVDGEQSISCEAFASLMNDLQRLAPAVGKKMGGNPSLCYNL